MCKERCHLPPLFFSSSWSSKFSLLGVPNSAADLWLFWRPLLSFLIFIFRTLLDVEMYNLLLRMLTKLTLAHQSADDLNTLQSSSA